MKKYLLLLMLVLVLTGCSKSKSIVIEVKEEEIEKVKIELNTKDGLDMEQKEDIVVFKKDKKEIATSEFSSKMYCDAILEQVATLDSVLVLEEEKDSIFYEYDKTSYIYYTRIKDANSCLTIQSASKESVEEIRENLTLTVE